MVDLGSLQGTYLYSTASAINAAGQVTGHSNQHAFSWTQAGGMVDLGALDGDVSIGTLVNDAGMIAGFSYAADFKVHAMLWLPAGDTTPPTLTVPADVITNATSLGGAVVSFTATATDNADPSPPVTCAPPSGSTFSIGTSTVSCTATDAAGNRASDSFAITVKGAAEQLADLATAVQGVGSGKSLAATVATAQWFLAHGQAKATCLTLTAFNLEVKTQSGKKIPKAKRPRDRRRRPDQGRARLLDAVDRHPACCAGRLGGRRTGGPQPWQPLRRQIGLLFRLRKLG